MLKTKGSRRSRSCRNIVGLNQITNGDNSLTLTTTSGAVLVSGENSYAVTTSMAGGVTHLLAGPNQQDVTASLSGGSLGRSLDRTRSADPLLSKLARSTGIQRCDAG